MLDFDAIKNFSIDKSDWQKVKLGDVVYEPKESVKDPAAEGIKHVVGLEHIDSEDIHLRRSASIEESTTFTKRFSKGDVLFGRRRAYLKKAAKACFEGVCSGDITVMRAKNELLIPELLPFIVNNDKFFDYAITHSAGGLSPRVKFKDLASYEFSIPLRDQQVKLLELFLSIDSLKNNEYLLEYKSKAIKEILLLRSLKGILRFDKPKEEVMRKTKLGLIPNDWEMHRLGDVSRVKGGRRLPKGYQLSKEDTGYPYIKAGDLKNGTVRMEKLEFISKEVHESVSNYVIHHTDTYITIVGAYIGDVGVIPKSLDGANLTENAAKISSGKINNYYLAYFLGSPLGQEQIKAFIGVGAQPKLALSRIENILIPLPSMKEQELIVGKIKSVEEVLEKIKGNILKCSELQKSLLNKVF